MRVVMSKWEPFAPSWLCMLTGKPRYDLPGMTPHCGDDRTSNLTEVAPTCLPAVSITVMLKMCGLPH